MNIVELALKKQEILKSFTDQFPQYREKLLPVLAAPIILNPRLKVAAGRANVRDIQIELNPTLLSQNPEQWIPTLAHEMGHLISVILYGRQLGGGHGRYWKSVMRALGQSPARCHQMKVPKTKKVAVVGYCNCHDVTHDFSKRQVKDLIRGLYWCRKCKTKIVTDRASIQSPSLFLSGLLKEDK